MHTFLSLLLVGIVSSTVLAQNTAVSELTFSEPFYLELLDNAGNVCTSFNDGPAVTATLTVGTGTLNGTSVVPTVNGLAEFTDLTINLVGTDKIVTFTYDMLTVTSTALTIRHGAPAQLKLRRSPLATQPATAPQSTAVAFVPQTTAAAFVPAGTTAPTR